MAQSKEILGWDGAMEHSALDKGLKNSSSLQGGH